MGTEADLKLAEETVQKIRTYLEKANDPAYEDIKDDPFLTYLSDHERENLCLVYSKSQRVHEMMKVISEEEEECHITQSH